jgi:hypothetical protein
MQNLSDIFSTYKIIWQSLSEFWWVILPMVLWYIFKYVWKDYVIEYSADSWLNKQEWTVLEIIPPKDVEKSPKVMESVYAGIAGVVVSIGVFDEWLEGALTDRFSLEIVGDEGTVHFYIRTQKKFRNLIEAQIYAQFPDAEIIEVPDYTASFPKTIPNKNWDLWGADIEFKMPDPYPIRTYDKFEEDVTGTMIDPLAAMSEVIGKLGPGQHIWLQYIIEPLPEKWRDGYYQKLVDKLSKKAEKKEKNILEHLLDVVASLPKALFGPVEFAADEAKNDQPLEFKLTPGEKEVLKAVEENFGRNAFKTKMRLLFLGQKNVFDKTFVSSFFGSIKQFSDLNMNNLKPNDVSKTYAYYLLKKSRMAARQRKIYRRYKSRSMDGVKLIFSTKELATLFHFPNMEVKAPSVTMVQSKRSTAPANLPVE